MQLDYSGVDAELASLGSAPENAVALARTFAGIDVALDQLEQIDRELGLLEANIDQLAVAASRRAFEAAPLPARVVSAPAFTRDVPAPTFTREAPSGAREAPPAPFTAREAPAARAAHAPEVPDAAVQPAADAEEFETAARFESERAPEPSAEPESWPPLQHLQPDAAHDSPDSAVHSVPPPALTQSQEIVLPDPIPREELSTESGELRLDDEKPTSGSFSLDEEPPEEPAATRPPEPMPQPRRPQLPSFATDDIGDALEGSQPLSITGPRAGGSKAPPFTFDRDPDAEFDALLSEATDPNGIPTGDAEREADDLLHGLDDDFDDDVQADLATREFDPASVDTPINEVNAELAALLLDEGDESTEVLDRATLSALGGHLPAEAADGQEDTLTEFDSSELEVGELEIVVDEAPTKAPPPPPPPPAPGEKRPSLLGRFFGRNERE